MLKFIVINNYSQYLGTVRFKTSGDLEVTEANQDDQKYLQALLKRITKRGVQVFVGKQTEYGNVVYYKPMSKDKPDGYLEGVRDSFRSYGLTAYLLKPKQATLWRLIHQAGLPKEIRNKISSYMQDISEGMMDKMIKVLEEKRENYKEEIKFLAVSFQY